MQPLQIEVYTVPPRQGQALTKRLAGYNDDGPFGCKNCSWFERPATGELGACKPVGGPVHRDACCDYWNVKDAPQNQGKAGCEYVYVPEAKYECAECRYFDAAHELCWPVIGHIRPDASCNKWTP